MLAVTAALVAFLASAASAAVPNWQQCGGMTWKGDTVCGSGAGCVKIKYVFPTHYSQCQPGAAPQDPTPVPEPEPPAATTVPGTPATTGTPAGVGPGRDLQTGYYWIRAVAAPNFHKYMQSKPLYGTGVAVLGDYTTAGQFQIVDGQLVQLVSGAAVKPEKLLYGVVSETRYINDLCLTVTWSETKNTYGTFKWNGDGLTWTVAGVKRPNEAAWYVCAGQQMYINLGNYLYGTPSGCADQTIHYYNDKRANN
ncbi:carbohydrate-binding module family 1 protein [Amniculicola lignicola CBS 123094]|uniref:Carbohydrate-binding module family 1 protein n=1 Tax=Amniculicola lignicola CBS 123094 TaxID=1392246 RepID=A0A6A5WTW3_9PLEO|nr:carbohydrate-binding module family 1 protein [Amniculicola lignicola CBS 123094]